MGARCPLIAAQIVRRGSNLAGSDANHPLSPGMRGARNFRPPSESKYETGALRPPFPCCAQRQDRPPQLLEPLDERFEELLEELFDERLDEEFELELDEELELEFEEEFELEFDDEFELEFDELLPATMKLPSLRLVVAGAGRSMSGAMRVYSMACAVGAAKAVTPASAAEAIFQCRFICVTPLGNGPVALAR
ncbi:MAG: hypothetical protein K0R27_4126 [Xanthobacteraceae bacterium]|nr:hypothetical protein [Xanthobacteraceae bacterium]